jgi:dihydroorotate dehydrogenase (fumarate)
MADITTKYAGLLLRNPIIVGSCTFSSTVDTIKKLESQGAAAVVLKSLFEEEIQLESERLIEMARKDNIIYSTLSETIDYIDVQVKKENLEQYLKLISDAKKKIYIPIIASINCITPYIWKEFALKIQDAGADAIELNIFLNPSEPSQPVDESIYYQIVKEVRLKVTIPLTIKIGTSFSNPGAVISEISASGANGIVLFNRFYQTDIDIEKEKLTDGRKYSNASEYLTTLRWIALMSNRIKTDLAASNGIHNGETMIKMLLAGAKAVQVASVLYTKDFTQINEMLRYLEKWMEKKGYGYIDQFRGKLNSSDIRNFSAFERIQFMRYFSGME